MRASACAIVIVSLGTVVPAHADFLKLTGEAHGGAMLGRGQSGDQKDEAFFENAPTGMYGVRVGARIVILDAGIQHHQYRNGDRLATWTQFSAGVAFESALGSAEQKQAKVGPFLELGANVGFGLGTGQQVDPPLSNDEISDKGFLVEGRIGFGKHINKVIDIGIAVPIAWGFFFKNGVNDGANDTSNQYQGLHVEAVAYLRFNLKLL